MQQPQVFIPLLAKQFSGEITADESEQLREWLDSDVAHQRIAEEYQIVWTKAQEENFPVLEVDTPLALKRVMASIEAQEKTKLSQSLSSWGRIAAAIVFLIVAVFGIRQLLPSAPEMVSVEAGFESEKKVELPDGSIVYLRQGSKMEYPMRFDPKKRLVKLAGEAFFEVTHDDQRHFFVETSSKEVIEVLGTSFFVGQSKEAVTVLVKSGKVQFSSPSANKPVVVTAGKQIVLNKLDNALQLKSASSLNALAWHTGHLEFVNTPFKQVIADFEAYYGIDIEVENPALSQCEYTSPKVSNNLDQALQSLAKTYHLIISNRQPKQYILQGGTCL